MRNSICHLAFGAFLMMWVSGCDKNPSAPADDEGEIQLAGGGTTIFDATSNAFSTPAPNLKGERLGTHFAGDAAFEAKFIAAPAEVNDGLGPVFNNNSCIACHPRDGRGRPPFAGEKPALMFLRISLPGTNSSGGPNSVPGFGTQLFDKAIFGVQPLGEFTVAYSEMNGRFGDGEIYSLQVPRYEIINTLG